MKKGFLPIGLLSFIIFSLAGLFIFSSGAADKEISPDNEGAQSIEGAKQYLASLRNNQHTKVLDPKDVIAARAEAEQVASEKSSSLKTFTWEELGPDNMGGRTRALFFDNQDPNANTLYAGSVTGGIFKSENSGSTWYKVNLDSETACLNVSCMVQSSDGTIYVGTGEGFNTENYTAYGQFGYEGGFVGKGIFKSDGNDNFNLVQGTAPTVEGDVTEWAYINELAIDNNSNKLYAATHTGLKYASISSMNDWSYDSRYKLDSAIIYRDIAVDSIAVCDSFEIVNGAYVLYGSEGWDVSMAGSDTTDIQSVYSDYMAFAEQGNCYDVKVSNSGVLYTVLNNRIYVSGTGDATKLENRSVYPTNPDFVRKDNIDWMSFVVIEDKQGNILYEAESTSSEETDWHIDYLYNDFMMMGYPDSESAGRTEFALSPSDENVVYAMAARGVNPNKNSLLGIYMSEDNGNTWRTVAPGSSSTLNILGSSYGTGNVSYYQGDFDNTLVVFPNNPYKVLAGGIDLWVGEKINEDGYFNWVKKSNSQAIQVGGIYSEFYCHMDHHVYVFNPSNSNKLFIGTDGGVYLANISGSDYAFQSLNKNYNVAQFYSLDISTRKHEFVGGAQDIGTVYVSVSPSTGKKGEDLWRPANFSSSFPEGTDGGSVGFTTLRSIDTGGEEIAPPVFYSKGPAPSNQALDLRMRRSETLGFDYSLDFVSTSIDDDRYITPMALWESYDNEFSKEEVTWFAQKDYAAGDAIVVRSNVYSYPFDYILDEAIASGDSLVVKDIISNKLFLGVEDAVYMSINATDFSAVPTWWLISSDNNAGVEGTVQSLGFSANCNYLWAGTEEGRLFRISNIANAYDENTADVSSSNCIIATTEVMLPGEISQVITSVSVDPKNPNNVLVTLGNYGNENYIFYCTNGMSDAPSFVNKQGNLPRMPVYASILELDENTNEAVIGTEMGVWATNNIANANWYFASPEIGNIPVMAVKQRTFYKSEFTLTYIDPATGTLSYETYPAIENYKDIYVATHGRGVFLYDANAVGIDDIPMTQNKSALNMDVYPNPATTAISVSLTLPASQAARIDVYDFAGRLILSNQTGQLPAGKQNIDLNISSLTKGTYLMKCSTGNSICTKKFIVVK